MAMSKKLRVLLADDSRFFRAIESQFLKNTPTEITEADDSSLALSMIRNEKHTAWELCLSSCLHQFASQFCGYQTRDLPVDKDFL